MRNKTIKCIDALLVTAGAIATMLLILLVLLVSYNVIARYWFSASSIALEELSWHFYAAIFLLAIPYAVHTGSHVRIDLIYEGRSQAYKRWIEIIGTLLFMFPFALVTAYYGFQFTAQAVSYGEFPSSVESAWHQFTTDGFGEKSQDPGGLNNRFVIKSVIPISAFLLFLSGISSLLKLSVTPIDAESKS